METLWKMGRFSQPQLLWLVDFWLPSTEAIASSITFHAPWSCRTNIVCARTWCVRSAGGGVAGGVLGRDVGKTNIATAGKWDHPFEDVYFLIKDVGIIFPFAMLYSLPEGTLFVIFLASSSTEMVFYPWFSTLFVAKKGTRRKVYW